MFEGKERCGFFSFPASHLIFLTFLLCNREGCPDILFLDRNVTKVFLQLQKAKSFEVSREVSGEGRATRNLQINQVFGSVHEKATIIIYVLSSAATHRGQGAALSLRTA